MNTIIAVDFDGTIVDHMYPIIGDPVPRALEFLQLFVEAGANLMLWTMRSNYELEMATQYLRSNNILLWGINCNPQQKSWTSSNKQYANIYIDDAAFGCPLHKPVGFNRMCVNWDIVGPSVLRMI